MGQKAIAKATAEFSDRKSAASITLTEIIQLKKENSNQIPFHFVAMNDSVAKKTQETLGKVIKKPPLTEKLLGKPPFRYLHDIFSEVSY